jgi:hypothetical protein
MISRHGVVIWDKNAANDFRAEYPEFASVDDAILYRRFKFAARIVNNSKGSLVPCDERQEFYNLIIAHQCFMEGRGAGLTGQVSSASQGSVSMSMSTLQQGKFADPWLTSDYGKQYWLASAKYRTMFYVPDESREIQCESRPGLLQRISNGIRFYGNLIDF